VSERFDGEKGVEEELAVPSRSARSAADFYVGFRTELRPVENGIHLCLQPFKLNSKV
jgi:hypothetical protein